LAAPAGPPVVLVVCIHRAGKPGHGLPLRLIYSGSDAKTLAKEANGPMKEGTGYEARLLIGLQMPGADMTLPNS